MIGRHKRQEAAHKNDYTHLNLALFEPINKAELGNFLTAKLVRLTEIVLSVLQRFMLDCGGSREPP